MSQSTPSRSTPIGRVSSTDPLKKATAAAADCAVALIDRVHIPSTSTAWRKSMKSLGRAASGQKQPSVSPISQANQS